MIGETIDGRYKIVRLIGEGGMGAVYEARHRATKRRVALKLITETSARDNRERLQRFRREAKAAGRIESDHITQVFDLGTDADRGLPYMAMEYLEGEDLEELFHRIGRLPTDLALRVIAQALQGLAMAHEAGVVHRDIKPANIFLSRRDMGRRVVKLLDFGIAKIRAGQSPLTSSSPTSANEITGTGVLIGSPIYMSPEQTKGLRDLDPRTDVWSMGVVMYQALTGFTPHDDTEGIGDLILSINTKEVKVRERAPWVPAVVAQVVEKALTVKGKERFQDAREMLAAVQLLVEDARIDDAMVEAAAQPDPEEEIDELATTRPSFDDHPRPDSGDTLEVDVPPAKHLDRPPTVEVAVQSAAPASARLDMNPATRPRPNPAGEARTKVPTKPGASTTGPIISPRVSPPPSSPWPKRAVALAAVVFLTSGVVLLLDRDEPGSHELAAPPPTMTALEPPAEPPPPPPTATASATTSSTALPPDAGETDGPGPRGVATTAGPAPTTSTKAKEPPPPPKKAPPTPAPQTSATAPPPPEPTPAPAETNEPSEAPSAEPAEPPPAKSPPTEPPPAEPPPPEPPPAAPAPAPSNAPIKSDL